MTEPAPANIEELATNADAKSTQRHFISAGAGIPGVGGSLEYGPGCRLGSRQKVRTGEGARKAGRF
jgi:hypothetical protein